MTHDPITAEATVGVEGNGASAAPLVVFEPRCKVCPSELRTEIDAMLRRGDSQTNVRRHFNRALGHDFFTPNNLSVHARKHVYGPDPADWIRKSVRAKRMLGDPNAIPSRPSPEDALRAVMEVGLSLVDAAVTVPEPMDVIRAAKELKRIEREGMQATEGQSLREIKAFSAAVKKYVPEELWATIYDEFEDILARER